MDARGRGTLEEFIVHPAGLFGHRFRTGSSDPRLYGSSTTASLAINLYARRWWRPSTAIHEGDNDGNMWTIGDGSWLGLIADPPYPDYVSGANGLTGAFTRMLQLFFGSDELVFSVKTTHPLVTNKERQYTRCSDAAQEVVDARVLLGIHFRYADEEGRRLGRRVAHWTFMNFLRPAAGSQSAR